MRFPLTLVPSYDSLHPPLGGRLASDTYGVLKLPAMCQRRADPEARPRLCRCGSAQAGHQQHLAGLPGEEVYRFVNLA
jgi:hypothetical protein